MTARRLRLALDAASVLPEPLELAFELAERLDAELEGMFLEDVDLLRSAELTLVRQVNLVTATEESFDRASTERELRALADRARTLLAESARSRRVQWTFRVVRSRLDAIVEEAADLVLLQGRCLLPEREPARLGPPVLVLDATSPHGTALELAARLAQGAAEGGGELLVLVLAPTREAYQRAVGGVRAAVGETVRIRARHVGEGALAPALRELRGGLVVLGATPDWQPVVRMTRCPVVVVRSRR